MGGSQNNYTEWKKLGKNSTDNTLDVIGLLFVLLQGRFSKYESTYCIIPFKQNSRKCKLQRQKISDFLGMGESGMEGRQMTKEYLETLGNYLFNKLSWFC